MFVAIPDSFLRRLGVSQVRKGDTVVITLSVFGRVWVRAELECLR